MELYLRSYVRVDTECIVPIQILKKTPEEGLQFELQSKSLQAVQRFLSRRSMQAVVVQPRPVVQMRTEMEEAGEEGRSSGHDAADLVCRSSSLADM